MRRTRAEQLVADAERVRAHWLLGGNDKLGDAKHHVVAGCTRKAHAQRLLDLVKLKFAGRECGIVCARREAPDAKNINTRAPERD